MTISEWQKLAHECAVAHGWWDDNPTVPDVLCRIHSELSEAYQDYRAGAPIGRELADAMLRIMDLAEQLGINLEAEIKHVYEQNLKRPYRHGGKLA